MSREQNAKYKIDIRTRHTARDHSIEGRQVIGVDDIPNHLHRDFGGGVEFKYSEGFLGPVVFIRHQICDEAASLAQPLGFGQKKVGLFDLRFRSFAVLDVECGHIPPNDTSLIVEQRLVAHQKPAILPIVAQDALLSAEWYGPPQRCRAICAGSLKILRGDDTISIIFFLYIFQSEAGVIHHSLIYNLDGSFGVQYVNVCRNGVDDQVQIAFVRLQRFLTASAILDVCKEEIPGSYRTFRISHWETTNLEPSVDAISPSTTMFNLVYPSRLN